MWSAHGDHGKFLLLHHGKFLLLPPLPPLNLVGIGDDGKCTGWHRPGAPPKQKSWLRRWRRVAMYRLVHLLACPLVMLRSPECFCFTVCNIRHTVAYLIVMVYDELRTWSCHRQFSMSIYFIQYSRTWCVYLSLPRC